MTWKELKDKISRMSEEEQQKEVAVWGEDISLHKENCLLQKTKVCEEGMYFILI